MPEGDCMRITARVGFALLALLFAVFVDAEGNSFTLADTGTELTENLHRGNSAYTSGKYREAIDIYTGIISEYGLSTKLQHNLANSYAADGQTGMAVLHYLRGLRLDPGDDDLKSDLNLIRKKAGLFSGEPTVKERILGLYDMNQWLKRALAGYVLLTLLVVVNYRFPLQKTFSISSSSLAVLIIFCCLGAYHQYKEWNSGVITHGQVRLLLSPFESAPANGILEEGTIVYSAKEHGNYSYISDRKGRSGWIPTTAFALINSPALIYGRDNAAQSKLQQ